MPFAVSNQTIASAGTLEDSFVVPTQSRPNDFTPTNPSVVNTVNVGIAPPAPTAGTLQPTIQYAQAIAAASVAQFGIQETPLVITLLETLDDAGDLAGYLIREVPAYWFGNIQVVMNGLTDAQRTTISNLDIGSQLSVTKSFPNSTPSTVTQIMALEGISHDISPDRHIVTLYPNPARIYTYFIVGGYTTTTTRTNLVTNPSVEISISGWASGGTLTQSSTFAYAGTYSARTQIISAVTTDTNCGDLTGIVAGQTYTFSAYVRSSVARNARVYIAWLNGGTFISNTIGTTSTTSTSGFTRFTVTGVAPSTATVARPTLQVLSPSIGDFIYMDALLLESSASALPYFDGTYADTYTGYTLTAQQWDGTADGSTSTGTWGLTSSFVGSQLDNDTKGLA